MGRVSLSYVGLYGLVAGAVLLAVLCWSVGYRVGYGSGEEAWLRESSGGREDYPVDPLAGAGADVEGRGEPERVMGTDTGGAGEPAGGSAARVLTARGPVDRDPRREGYNYLELATLSGEQARAALAFLAGEGVEAIAVAQVDSAGGGANNPVRYRVVSIEVAIPGEQFRAMRTERLDHEGLIERLGSVWRREQKGASDFASPLWKRYP